MKNSITRQSSTPILAVTAICYSGVLVVESRPVNDSTQPAQGLDGNRIDCDQLQIGTALDLEDVYKSGADGGLNSQYISAQVEFLQSEPHLFYIKGGDSLLTGIPKVYSLSANSGEDDDNSYELKAKATKLESDANNDSVKIEVSYTDQECQNEYELM